MQAQPELTGNRSAQAASRRPRQRWRELCPSAMLFVSLACCWAVLRVVPEDPPLYRMMARYCYACRHRAGVPEAALRRLRARDPSLGSTLPLPRLIERGSGDPGRAGRVRPAAVLVVVIGRCSTCMLPTLQSADTFLQHDPQLDGVAISPSRGADLEAFRHAYGLRLAMAPDPGGLLGRRYNASWVPRLYLVSPDGRLIWRQNSFNPTYAEVIAAMNRYANQSGGSGGRG